MPRVLNVLKGILKIMFITISLTILFINAVFIYFIIFCANKCKYNEEIETEEKEQIKALEKWREQCEEKSKKKRYIFSRFRTNSR